MFLPLRTERLLIRSVIAADADALLARRNEPEVAQFQNWTLPYPAERVATLIDDVVESDGPADGRWWMATIAELGDGTVVGDLAVHLTDEGRVAEIGYTLAGAHWGRGYATEAVDALLDNLFDVVGVRRIAATLHPDNAASARVLERCGFRYEGRTRASFRIGDEVSDDLIYGLLPTDLSAWRARPRDRLRQVELVAIDADNAHAVRALRTHASQEAFVAPVDLSFADALVPEVVDGAPVVPWMRAVSADGELVGFVMLALVTAHHPEPYLWRLLVDRRHQRRGVGTRALDLVDDVCRSMGATTLLTSWGEGVGSPRPFYVRRGFEPTGAIVDGETEARIGLE